MVDLLRINEQSVADENMTIDPEMFASFSAPGASVEDRTQNAVNAAKTVVSWLALYNRPYDYLDALGLSHSIPNRIPNPDDLAVRTFRNQLSGRLLGEIDE